MNRVSSQPSRCSSICAPSLPFLRRRQAQGCCMRGGRRRSHRISSSTLEENAAVSMEEIALFCKRSSIRPVQAANSDAGTAARRLSLSSTRCSDAAEAKMPGGSDASWLKERSRVFRPAQLTRQSAGSPPWSTDRELWAISRTRSLVSWLKAPKWMWVSRLLLRIRVSRLVRESKTPSDRLLMYLPERSRVPLPPRLESVFVLGGGRGSS